MINLFFSYNYNYCFSLPRVLGAMRLFSVIQHMKWASYTFPPWSQLCPLAYSHETQRKMTSALTFTSPQANPLPCTGKHFSHVTFPLIQLNPKIYNNSSGLKVKKKIRKSYLKSRMVLIKQKDSKHGTVTENILQNVYKKFLSQFSWFQAHGYYSYSFLLNKTVKIKISFRQNR